MARARIAGFSHRKALKWFPAVEPGLWDRRTGGVRYEDLLLVTEAGCETLTAYPYELTPRVQ